MGLLSRAEELLEQQFIDMTSDAFVKVFREAYDREHEAHPFEVHDDMLDALSRILDEDFNAVFPQGEVIDPLKLRTPVGDEYNPLTWGMED